MLVKMPAIISSKVNRLCEKNQRGRDIVKEAVITMCFNVHCQLVTAVLHTRLHKASPRSYQLSFSYFVHRVVPSYSKSFIPVHGLYMHSNKESYM